MAKDKDGSKGGSPAKVKATKGAFNKQKCLEKPKPKKLPQWKVLLHNDDKNTMDHVVKAIVDLVHLSKQDAEIKMKEAHKTGISLLLVTHKELAELKRDQLQSKSLTVSIEEDK